MSTNDKTRRLTLERTYRAPLEKVWELWTTKAGIESWWGPDGFTVEVAFKKPILLPGKVEFCEAQGPGAAFNLQFGVRDPGKGSSHLDGLAFSG